MGSYFYNRNERLIFCMLELLISRGFTVTQLDSLGFLLYFYLKMWCHFIAFTKWVAFVFTWKKKLRGTKVAFTMHANFYLLTLPWLIPCLSFHEPREMLSFSSCVPAEVHIIAHSSLGQRNYNFSALVSFDWPVCPSATGLPSLLLGYIICEMWTAPPHILGDVMRIN